MLLNPQDLPSTQYNSEGEKLKTDINFVNSLLLKLNFDSPFPFLNVDEPMSEAKKFEISRACSILIPLLTSKGKEQAFRSDVEGRVHILAQELSEKNITITKQQTRIEELERENRNIKIQNQYLSPLYSDDLDANRVSELETKVKSLEKTSTNAKEEASRLRTAFQLKEKQFTHELRKREKAFEKLKEQLQSTFNREAVPSVNANAELSRMALENECGPRLSLYGEPLESTNPNEGLQISDRVTGLEIENENLRQLLISLSGTLTEMKILLELDDLNAEMNKSPSALSNALNGLPFKWTSAEVREDIEGSIQSLSKRIALICGIPLSEQ